MVEETDERTDRRADGRPDERTDGRTNGRTDGRTVGESKGLTYNGRTGGRGQTDGRTRARTPGSNWVGEMAGGCETRTEECARKYPLNNFSDAGRRAPLSRTPNARREFNFDLRPANESTRADRYSLPAADLPPVSPPASSSTDRMRTAACWLLPPTSRRFELC